jgi:protein-tyrosine phosphatase
MRGVLLLSIFVFLSACSGEQGGSNLENCDNNSQQTKAQLGTRSEVRLQGQPNFRDIGGYITSDGRKVKQGLVFRSGELPRLTDKDVQTLQALDIKTVVNFLQQPEIDARGEDRLPPNVRQIHLPMSTAVDPELPVKILRARQTGDFTNVPVEFNPEIHRLLIQEANSEYASLIREVARPENRPLVFHCSHGVHRTGTAAAILLSALGVSWETVREDYLLSNAYRKDEIERRLVELQALAAETFDIEPEQVDMTNIKAFYILQPEYIDASLEQSIKQYGSMSNYIREGLGITDKELVNLREQLLER